MSSILCSSKARHTQRPLFCALVREEAIFAICKRSENEGFACMSKEKEYGCQHYIRVIRAISYKHDSYTSITGVRWLWAV